MKIDLIVSRVEVRQRVLRGVFFYRSRAGIVSQEQYAHLGILLLENSDNVVKIKNQPEDSVYLLE